MKLDTAGWVVGAMCAVVSFFLAIICIVAIVLASEVMDVINKNYRRDAWTSSYLIAVYLRWFELIATKKWCKIIFCKN